MSQYLNVETKILKFPIVRHSIQLEVKFILPSIYIEFPETIVYKKYIK